MDKAYHSGDSEADNSQTPQWVINQIQDIANLNIIFDVCATAYSAKSEFYYDKGDDALAQDWSTHVNTLNYNKANDFIRSIATHRQSFWMNPPFSLAKEFTTKAADEALKGCVTIGCVKHAPDADWFQEMEKRATFIYVPDGRIQFLKADGTPFTRIDKNSGKIVKSGANFPLCFPLWTPFNNGGEAKQIRFKRDQKRYLL